jgi:hypothetical protein
MSTILTLTVARLILLPTLVTAIAILVKGYASVGDGFSAGVIASTGVVIQFLSRPGPAGVPGSHRPAGRDDRG